MWRGAAGLCMQHRGSACFSVSTARTPHEPCPSRGRTSRRARGSLRCGSLHADQPSLRRSESRGSLASQPAERRANHPSHQGKRRDNLPSFLLASRASAQRTMTCTSILHRSCTSCSPAHTHTHTTLPEVGELTVRSQKKKEKIFVGHNVMEQAPLLALEITTYGVLSNSL